MDKGLLIVISGPSGSGKDTLVNRLLATDTNIFISVSATTRKKRKGEIEDRDYYFFSRQEFEELIKENGLLEYAEYCGNLYGTPKKQVFEMLDSGRDVILIIEVNGALQVRSNYPDAVMIFIMPPSIDELKKRLTGRDTDSPESIEERLKTASFEISKSKEYDYIIINDTVESAVLKLKNIIIEKKLNKGFYVTS